MPIQPANDALGFGVYVKRAEVPIGTWVWRVTKVHHLSGAENLGNHNVFFTALGPLGDRIKNAHLKGVNCDGTTIHAFQDKGDDEPGGNFPLFSHDLYSVLMAPELSDVVCGLHTAHPQDEPGNTLYHHSFFIEFMLVQETEGQPLPQTKAEVTVDRVWDDAAGPAVTLTIRIKV